MQLVPVAQAVTMAVFGPLRPRAMAIWAAGILGISIGMKKGLMRLGPFSAYFMATSTKVCITADTEANADTDALGIFVLELEP